MTMRARGANAARGNEGVCSGKHGQRRLLLWCAAGAGGWCEFSAALVRGGCRPCVPRTFCFLFLSRCGARDSHGRWGGGVSRRRPRGGGHGRRERGKAGKAGEHFSGRVECTCEPVSGCRNDHENGIPGRKIPGGDAGKGFGGKRAKRVYALDGCRRNGVQADCRTDRAEGCLLEEARREGGSRRADWTGTIRVAGGRVGPERGGDPGEGGGERERRIERARPVARETWGGGIGWIEYGRDGGKAKKEGGTVVTRGGGEPQESPFQKRALKITR